ncbi:hypothetical protein RDI58_018013 [Solanum bulbocastanum]|uniref:Uncharacterized protein n=1 Tax=Solanum bulbocastanum TaxID=147425 RepID=A0AAN8YCK1_SOLBU
MGNWVVSFNEHTPLTKAIRAELQVPCGEM